MNDLVVQKLDRIAEDARKALKIVRGGEDIAMSGWVLFGHALLEGRREFPKGGQGDKDFGAWKVASQLATPTRNAADAAMWAAEFPADFHKTRKAHPRVRTVRGLHAKNKEAQKGPPKPERRAPTMDDLRKVERLRALRDDEGAPEGGTRIISPQNSISQRYI